MLARTRMQILSIHKKWYIKRKNQNKNNNKSKGKGFNVPAKEGTMTGIVLTTNRTTPPSGLYKKFIQCVQVLANEKGMQHVAHCIENLQDLGDDDFKPVETDMSNCVTIIEARKMDSNGNPLQDIGGKYITEEVKIITNRDAYDKNCELQNHKMKKKEEEQHKFKDNKILLLGQMLA